MRSIVRAGVASLFCFAALDAADAPPGLVGRVLAPRSVTTGSTLFTEIKPSESGIVTQNPYDDSRMWSERYLEFTVGAIGTGIAVGDYDHDGLPDIFVVSKTGPCRLFRNLGGFKFEDVSARAGIGGEDHNWKQGVTFVDIDNDGWLDVYVCRFGAPNLLFINQHDGTFRERGAGSGLDVVDASGMAAFADYDRDGKLDVFLQTNLYDAARHPAGQRDYLFHNRGDGTFTNVTDAAGITGESQGHSATWWDFDQDGWPDLYVANDFARPDQLYRNNANGTFTDVINTVAPHIPHSSMGADIGDVNNDGRLDLFVLDMAASTAEKDQRGMAGERARTLEDADSATVPQHLRNALLLNTGTAHLQEAAQLAGIAATDWAWSARLEDLDNDGRVDLHVTNGMIREETNTDLLQRMMAAESPAERIRILRGSPVLQEKNFAFRNAGDLRFEDVSKAWGLDQAGVSFGAAFGDFDGDGDLDLVFANLDTGITLLRNDAPAGHRVIFELKGTQSNTYGVGATVRIETADGPQVRMLTLARGYLSSSEPVVHFGLGAADRIRRVTIEWPSGVRQVFEDLPADRRYVVTETGPRAAAVVADLPPPQFSESAAETGLASRQREAAVNETAEQRLLSMRHHRLGPAVAAGDFDGDGQDELFFGGTVRDPGRLALRAGPDRFALQPIGAAPAAANDGPALIFDADGDGRNDLLVTRGGAALPDGAVEYQPQLYLNSGGGLRPAAADVLPELHFSVGAVAAADWNRDGTLDVFLGGRLQPGDYPHAPRSALLANRGGRFTDITASVAPALARLGMITSALWSDVDADGWPDLIVTVEWGGVHYFHNDHGVRLEDWSQRAGFESAGTGWWNAVVAADFNGDGRLDYALGNLGLNTPFTADPLQPALLFYGDFGGFEGPQIIEARHAGDLLVPWRSRRELGAVLPSILKRFPRNDLFARASLGDIVGSEVLARAERYAATEFRSGVLLSAADGTYRFAPLPRVAQIAPIFGLAAGDFDGDGRADLCAVQNSRAPVPGIGNFDGGLGQFLHGDGHGGFTAVPPARSGWIVPGDAKGLAALDLDRDGWADFVVTRNDDTTLLLRNRGVAGAHAFTISLQGRPGNPQAIGARITVTSRRGSRQMQEIAAGGGHWSQSSAAAFFGWSDDDPPQAITIRWPDGRITEQPAPAPVAPQLNFPWPQK